MDLNMYREAESSFVEETKLRAQIDIRSNRISVTESAWLTLLICWVHRCFIRHLHVSADQLEICKKAETHLRKALQRVSQLTRETITHWKFAGLLVVSTRIWLVPWFTKSVSRKLTKQSTRPLPFVVKNRRRRSERNRYSQMLNNLAYIHLFKSSRTRTRGRSNRRQAQSRGIRVAGDRIATDSD